MTPEQLEEIPGIGEKTLEKISVAVRHYFGQYEEGEERPVVAVAEPAETAEKAALEGSEVESEEKTPEEILAAEASVSGQRPRRHAMFRPRRLRTRRKTVSESDAV